MNKRLEGSSLGWHPRNEGSEQVRLSSSTIAFEQGSDPKTSEDEQSQQKEGHCSYTRLFLGMDVSIVEFLTSKWVFGKLSNGFINLFFSPQIWGALC